MGKIEVREYNRLVQFGQTIFHIRHWKMMENLEFGNWSRIDWKSKFHFLAFAAIAVRLPIWPLG